MKISIQVMASVMLAISVSPCYSDELTDIEQATSAQEKAVVGALASKVNDNANSASKPSVHCEIDSENCYNVERITVTGARPVPLSVTAEGAYVLDQDLLRQYSFGNGNLNDVLAVLPGVQFSESAYSATQVSNIRPAEVSIAGTQGYQTAYQVDGVVNNSKLSTGNAQIDRNLVQDVSGHSQQSFINVKLLEDVTVYDSNIPARYGDFSGGLVLANTRNAEKHPHFGMSLRGTGDNLIRYHRFYSNDFDGTSTLDEATFSKLDFSTYLSLPITDKLGMVAQFQQLESKESYDQLGSLREKVQTNTNAMVKFDYALTDKDDIQLRLLYAPYSGDYFDELTLNSDYTIDGGGTSALLAWDARRDWGSVDTQLSWNQSENSKTAPNLWFSWKNVPGKAWGDYNDSISSPEGGYGDIEKVQNDIRFRQDFTSTRFSWLDVDNYVSTGYAITHQNVVFDRLEDAILYNGSVLNANVNCGSYILDCVNTTFHRPISAIEAELGRPLNLLDPDDFLLYQENILTSGQYFQTRQISPKSRSEASVVSASAYYEHTLEWPTFDITAGVRYDYNDFFANHDLAPRIRAQYTLWEKYQVILGANRYYQGSVLNYKLNSAITPFISQVRNTFQNVPGQWQSAVVPSGPRYVYNDLATPYGDEFTLGYRQPLLGGLLELRYVDRTNKDSINREKGYGEQGEPILFAQNNGESEYQRYSITWMANFAQHHVELNISHASNTTSRRNFDGDTVKGSVGNESLNYTYDDSELIYLRTDTYNESGVLVTKLNLITRHDLSLEQQDTNRPIIANVSWGMDWRNWEFSAHARYMGSQEAIYPTSDRKTFSDATQVCSGCTSTQREYQVYRLAKRPQFWLVNANLRYHWNLAKNHEIILSAEVLNLFNSRTHQVAPFTTGLELGRQVWFGINYDY